MEAAKSEDSTKTQRAQLTRQLKVVEGRLEVEQNTKGTESPRT